MKPHLLHVFSTFAAGGPQVRTARLIAALGGAYRHSILAMDGVTEARALLPEAAGTRLLSPPPPGRSPGSVRALRRILASERADLVLTYNWGAIEAVLAGRLLRGTRLLHHEDGFRPDELDGFKRRRVWARRLLLRGARGVIVPSETLRRIATELWRLSPARVHHVPNGIRIADFPPADGGAAVRAELAIPRAAFVVGSVGHLRAEKNFPRLVTALSAMEAPDAHLVLLGEGPARGRIEETARARGVADRVHMVGHRARPQPYYRAMDAFAMSSDTEQMPIALLEAMATRLPVAATDVGDVRRMLPEEAGSFLVDARSGDAAERLAAALERLARDPELRERLGRANRSTVEHRFSLERMVAAYRRLYEACLAPG